ncbi:SagB family peptide dehydrogenase [Novibacillus thermophilus]|jgi:SagB-type dehydrogenase family enzyme|uniref:NADH oxidase n=1 Tax=Novibacillus thermophilus TaxID=1471761 RepID=A0A1U9K8U4_9BACL|nr:SagB family peptide dehydrogenase [Novibacillus thermophilus]AQS56487.1 hypothetical protein B0W44_12670 [Novibacillus thermophilus]
MKTSQVSFDVNLFNLQYHPEKVTPKDWTVNSEEQPRPFKTYRGLPSVRLDHRVPDALGPFVRSEPGLFERLSALLWHSYGLTTMNWLTKASKPEEADAKSLTFFRRNVASGGALYPAEIYLCLKGFQGLSAGVYHYDPKGHRLVLLREGDMTQYVQEALGIEFEEVGSSVYLLLTVRFCKNFFKYLNFSYRLHGLDTGVLAGQLLTLLKALGMQATVHYNFVDQALRHLLNIDSHEETVYAVISANAGQRLKSRENKKETADTLADRLPPVDTPVCEENRRGDYSMIVNLNNQAECETVESFKRYKDTQNLRSAIDGQATVRLTERKKPVDLLQASLDRISPGERFKLSELRFDTLSNILTHHGLDGIKNDVIVNRNVTETIHVFFYAHHVEGLAQGYYYVDRECSSVRLMKKGDLSPLFQQGLTRKNFNLHQVPLVIHLTSAFCEFVSSVGTRGYRILQMEAGMLTQQKQLFAAGFHLGAHPMLSYDAGFLERALGLDDLEQTILMQIALGEYKPLLRLANTLF